MALFCLILGSGFLSHPDYDVNPDAVAVAGAAVAVREEAGQHALSIVIDGPRAGALREVARLAAGSGAARALSARQCSPGTRRTALIGASQKEAWQDAVLWPPEMLDAGAGPAPEATRSLREQTGLAVPRPVAPPRHRVSVLRLPGDVAEKELLAAAFRSPWTSWIYLGGQVYLVTDDPVLVAEMTQANQAEIVADEIELGRLRLIEGALPDGAKMLGEGSGMRLTLCPAECRQGVSWHERRFSRMQTELK